MKIIGLLIIAISLFASDYALMKKAFDKGDLNRAITFARTNAMRGTVPAMYDLGLLYYAKGDIKKAKTWLVRSVKNEGKGELAVSLILFVKSTKRAEYIKVTESLINVPSSKTRDALMAVSKDLADNRFDASAEDYLILGELFSADRIVRPDMRVALYLMDRAAKKESVIAMEKMGDAYWQSSYTQGNFIMAPQSGDRLQIAFEYYQSATESGSMDAMAKLGKLYIVAPWMVANVQKGSQLIITAAEAGSALGAQFAGELYWNGTGVYANKAESLKWYKKATDICEVNKILANYYRNGSEAEGYTEAYKRCHVSLDARREYNLLFEPF